MKKYGKRILAFVFILLLIITLYLAIFPVPINPVKWNAPQSAGYVGSHTENTRLAGMKYIKIGNYQEPEHIVYRSNWLYAAMRNGEIIRVRPDGSELEVIVNTQGRPLGFDFDSEGALIVADPMYGEHGGLLRVTDFEDKAHFELLTDSVDGIPILFADAVVVAQNGLIYFTDASERLNVNEIGDVGKAGELDILGNSCTGRLLKYNPTTNETSVVMQDLCFANGITLSEDEQYLFLNETGKYRVWKIDLSVENIRANQSNDYAQVIIDNLPGLPDNLMRGQDGRIWIGLVHPRNDFLDFSSDKPWMRSLAMRLPNFLLPKGEGYSHAVAFDESGNILADLQDPNGFYTDITGVTETDGKLYFHHLNKTNSIGWISKNNLGF
ncbi:SMP-30/gluconolactonase/LRE family protein [Peribacillus alkalitolerans]|uniref:SMP-30/gluconolactonase/LRE family protein n=1 Tax=Peribacillus alkalitolerans TaxID=1550385 RepID=UPI0013D197EC|nr:SMP-30/gluconolactonase/LRE family protein [Peribacillus alkalitolerans]